MDDKKWTKKKRLCYRAFPLPQTSTSTKTRTANCARHLGVIVGKMLPAPPPPQIYTSVAKEEILVQPLRVSFSQRSHFQNLDRIAVYTKSRLNWIDFFFFIYRILQDDEVKWYDMLSAIRTCHISVMTSVAFHRVMFCRSWCFLKPINGAQNKIKRRNFV